MFKKIFAAFAAAVLSVSVFSSCGNASVKDEGKLNVVCTVFSCYDWTRAVVGDSADAEVTYLLSNGTDLHSFQPTADDMIKISDCDVFVYVGGESDAWIDDALKNARNKDMIVVDLMDVLSENVKLEEVKEGMADTEEEDSDEPEYDEHIWLSVNNAEKCVTAIADALSEKDSKNSEKYNENSINYNTQLQMLDRSFHLLFDDNPQTLIFGDRFPFRYLIDDYQLEYFAAFTGCSSDTQASFETITFLANKADELNADHIFAIENSDCTIAEAVVSNTKTQTQEIAILDSIQSVTSQQIDDGYTYYSSMQKNYDILKEVFSRE